MSRVTFIFLAVFTLAAKGSVISSWESDVTKWPLDSLNDGDCKRDLQEYATALTRLNGSQDAWALKMLDSSAKIPNGILAMNFIHIGVYHECLSIQHPQNRFLGKHCMLSRELISVDAMDKMDPKDQLLSEIMMYKQARPKQTQPTNRQMGISITFEYGVCIPSTCNANDLNTMLSKTKIKAIDEKCWTSEKKYLSNDALTFIGVCGAIVGLIVLSTCYHYTYICLNKKPTRLLCAFSLYLNVPKLIEVRSNDADNMGCLHGIRTMSMMWVVLGHTYSFQMAYSLVNMNDLTAITKDFGHIPVGNGYFSVDSFFFLSGLLIAFVFFRNVNRTGGYDVLSGYIHRWIRLTPPIAMIIFGTVTLLPESGSGPMWHDTLTDSVASCKDSWWTIILYVQNYVKPVSQCLGQSWYLSADMQMFWVAPFILYPILLWPTYGTALLGILIVGSTLWTFAIDYSYNFASSLLLVTSTDQFQVDYVAFHMRMTPWLVGMACGVAICAIKARKIQIRMKKWQVLLGWCLNTVLGLAIVFSIHRFQTDPDAPAVESALYLAFTRLGWGVLLAWIVFACIHGYGGPINSFLSLGVWQPLGKLSYGVYCLHITVASYKAATMQTNGYFSDLSAVDDFWSTLVMSYLVAVVLYLTIEAPIAIMDQEILGSVKIFQYPRSKPKNTQPKEEKLEEGAQTLATNN